MAINLKMNSKRTTVLKFLKKNPGHVNGMKLLIIILTALTVSTAVSCSRQDPSFSSRDYLMGTVVNQKIYGAQAEKAGKEAIERLKVLESMLSFHSTTSEIAKLNSHAGIGKTELSPETIFLLKKSLFYSQATNGSFNILVGPLVRRWKVTEENPDIPTAAEIKRLLLLTNYRDLIIDDAHHTALLKKKGEMADLGGIAKGFASDEVIAIYKKNKITSAIIDIGGNIGVLGKNPDGELWRVGVQDPRKERGEFVGYLDLTDCSLSTSGAYERFFRKDGKVYHHIIDPSTGYPSESDIISATVIAPKSVDSDALSKIFVMGSEKGIAVIKKMTGAEAVVITKDNRVIVTDGLKNRFHPAESKEFTVLYK